MSGAGDAATATDLADVIERFMVKLGMGGGPRYGTLEWNALAADGMQREEARRRAYLAAHPEAPRFPDEDLREAAERAAKS